MDESTAPATAPAKQAIDFYVLEGDAPIYELILGIRGVTQTLHEELMNHSESWEHFNRKGELALAQKILVDQLAERMDGPCMPMRRCSAPKLRTV